MPAMHSYKSFLKFTFKTFNINLKRNKQKTVENFKIYTYKILVYSIYNAPTYYTFV